MKAIQSITFVSLFFTLLIFSCGKKDDPAPSGGGTNNSPCVTNNTLSLEVKNNSSNEYEVTYNGSQKVNVAGNTTITIDAQAGSSSVRVIQKSGIQPNINAADVTLTYSGAACSNQSVIINNECTTVGLVDLTVRNNSTFRYKVVYNSNQEVEIAGGESKVLKVPSGNGSVRATQLNGVISAFGAAVQNLSYTGTPCSSPTVQIQTECNGIGFFDLTIRNTSSNNYRVTYNSSQTIDIPAGGSNTVQVRSGSGSVRAVQLTGINSTFGAANTLLQYNGTACGAASVSIPNECASIGISTLILRNNSSNPYRVTYANNVFLADVPGNSSTTLTIRAGSYSLKATQISGFLFNPTIREATLNAVGCNTYTFNFPN